MNPRGTRALGCGWFVQYLLATLALLFHKPICNGVVSSTMRVGSWSIKCSLAMIIFTVW